MNYHTAKIEHRGVLVKPTTPCGRALIRRALRRPFPGPRYPDEPYSVRTAERCGVIPVTLYHPWMDSTCDADYIYNAGVLAIYPCGRKNPPKFLLSKDEMFSRHCVEMGLDGRFRDRELQFAAQEQRECYDAARNRAWKFTKADKATSETMHAAIKREKKREEERERRAELRERLAFVRDRIRREEVTRALGNPQTQSRRSKRAQLRALGIPA